MGEELPQLVEHEHWQDLDQEGIPRTGGRRVARGRFSSYAVSCDGAVNAGMRREESTAAALRC